MQQNLNNRLLNPYIPKNSVEGGPEKYIEIGIYAERRPKSSSFLAEFFYNDVPSKEDIFLDHHMVVKEYDIQGV